MSEKPKKTGCSCPFCDMEIIEEYTHFCQPCQVELRYCSKCNIVVEKKAKVCPQCGQAIE